MLGFRLKPTVLALGIAVAWVFPAPQTAAASSPMQFARIGGDNGLSAGGVMAIVQDRHGFIWLGTEDGLDRYDGYRLQHQVLERGRPGGIPSNWISALVEDDDETLWVATDGGGLVGRSAETGQFAPLPVIDGQPPISSQESLRVVTKDRHGSLWIGTRDNGLVMVDRKGSRVRHFRHAAGDETTISDDSVFAVIEDHSGMLWVGTAAGLDKLDPATGRFERQRELPGHTFGAADPKDAVTALVEDFSGDIWAGTGGGLVRRRARTGEYTVFRQRTGDTHSVPSDQVQTLLEDHAKRLWIGTAAGLALYDRAAERFDTYRNNPADASTLPDDYVLSLFEDRGGLLWVGTKSGGIAIWNSRSWSFGQHAGGVGDSNVAAFAEDPAGTLWISNFGAGLDAVDRLHGTVEHFRHSTHAPFSLPDDRVMALLVDRRGSLWIGTMTAGLSRFDPQTRKFITYRHDPNDPTTLGAPGVMSLLEDSHGRIWVGTFGGGLSLLNSSTGRFTRYTADAGNPTALSSNRVTALAEDGTGQIWVGTGGGGLCLLDPSSGRFVRYMHDPKNARSLGANTVYAVHVDEHGTVWVGTRGGGLDRIQGSARNPGRIAFQNFSEPEGLSNTTIYGVENDSSGRLWLSTNRGLSRLDPTTLEVRNFRRAHGLQGDEFNFGSHYRSANGELFFGGPNGYNAFIPERLEFNDQPPPVALTAFLKLNEPAVTPQQHERLKNIDLGYRDDIVSFEFAALDFASPADNRYRYRLEGFDKDWVDAGPKHQATYTNLAGGHYVFRVMASNSDGVWNEAGLALPISVQPPPWLSFWAYAGYVIGLICVLFAVWNHQHRKLRREETYAKRLEQDVRDQTRELALRNDDLERVNEQLREASLTDPLTGLGNRRYLHEAVDAVMFKAASPPTLSLLIVDLDHLKPVNDLHGHQAGDNIIKQVASILRSACRESDFIARWGGDEFVIVSRDQDLNAAADLAERIRMRVAKQIFRLSEGNAARCSCSIGFSRYPFVHEAPELLPWEQCLAMADAALYHAKKQRNGWVGWAGTPAALQIPSIARVIEQDAEELERSGYIEVRRPAFRPEDTINSLYVRRRGDSERL